MKKQKKPTLLTKIFYGALHILFSIGLALFIVAFIIGMIAMTHIQDNINKIHSNQDRVIVHSCGNHQTIVKSNGEVYTDRFGVGCNKTVEDVKNGQ